MAGVIIIVAVIILCTSLKGSSARREEKKRKDELARQREAIRRWRKQTEALAQWQERQSKEQALIVKEQERQAKELEKHTEQLKNLEYRVGKAQFDIDFLHDRIENLYAMMDNYKEQQAACTPMSSEWDKWQRKILSLDNQIHSAESRMGKAQFEMERAKAKMVA